MANNPLSAEGSAASWPDWPTDGVIRPLFSTRVEWKAKALLRKVRRPSQAPLPGDEFDLDSVYQLSASPHPPVRGEALVAAFRNAVEPAQAIDATFAALALAISAGDRPRTEGLAAFLDLCYRIEDLDSGASRMGAYLRDSDAASKSVFAGLEYQLGWRSLAAGVHRHVLSMGPPTPRPERRLIPELRPRRVVARLSGGLGNQLFQYAAALSYAHRIHAPLRLDLANYEGGVGDREFMLGRLQVPVRRANSFEVLSSRLRPHRDTRGAFDTFLSGNHGSTWLCGFWENPAYFADIVPTVRHRFRPRNRAVTEAASALVQRARQHDGPVIGVHLRRGDRGPGGTAFSPFSSLPASYYRQAASRFPSHSNFLVFSDTPEDIAWCRSHLGLPEGANVTFSDGLDPILDIFALAHCDHVILSTGTFSWWAGFLGDRPGRRVLAPNPLQGLAAAMVMIPTSMPLQPGWEEITLAPGSHD